MKKIILISILLSSCSTTKELYAICKASTGNDCTHSQLVAGLEIAGREHKAIEACEADGGECVVNITKLNLE